TDLAQSPEPAAHLARERRHHRTTDRVRRSRLQLSPEPVRRRAPTGGGGPWYLGLPLGRDRSALWPAQSGSPHVVHPTARATSGVPARPDGGALRLPATAPVVLAAHRTARRGALLH